MKSEDFTDDSLLVEACIEGDAAAWTGLARKYERLIYASIDNRLKKYGFSLPREEIEDIRQNVLTAIWRGGKLAAVRNRKDISYWVAMVSGNMAIEYMRTKHGRDTQRLIPVPDETAEELANADRGSCAAGPFEDLAEKEAVKKVERCLAGLPSKERLIMRLHIHHEKKYHEISEILNIPRGTVSSYIKRARKRLKDSLGDL